MLDQPSSDSLVGAVRDAVMRIRSQSRGVPLADLLALSNAVAARASVTMTASMSSDGETLLIVVVAPRSDPPPGFDGLTPRQAEVMELMARGCSNRHIAETLGISVATVKDHVHAVLRRTGSANRAVVAARGRRADSNAKG